MPLEEINDSYYYKSGHDLISMVPEVKELCEEEADLPSCALFAFGVFFKENIDNEKFLENTFRYINHALDQGGQLTRDTISEDFFYSVFQTSNGYDLARKYLPPEKYPILDEFLDEYNDLYT